MAHQKLVRLLTKVGAIGTIATALGGIKLIWKGVVIGGDMEFLAHAVTWLWQQLDKPIVLLPTFIGGIGLVLWALLRNEPITESGPEPRHSATPARSRTHRAHTQYQAMLDNLELIHIAALQFMLAGDVRESELVAHLEAKGFAVPPDYLTAIVKRTALVERTHDGHGRIIPAYTTSIENQLPKFQLGNTAELDLKKKAEGRREKRPELYQGRNDTRPSLLDLSKSADVLWIATHEATNLRGQGLLKHPLKRLIVLHPGGTAVDLFSTVEGAEKSVDAISQDIELSIQDAKRNGVAVRTFDGPITAMIIGNPTSQDGWAQVEMYFPWSEAHQRPSILFRRSDYPDCFTRLIEVFESMWDRPVRPSPAYMQKERQRLADIQIKDLTDLCNAFKEEATVKGRELQEVTESFTALRSQHGRWRITQCGKTTDPIGLSVAIQFSESRDSDLAKLIRGFFWQADMPWQTYKSTPVEQTLWKDNPSSQARIVIFSDHDHAAGIKAAFNDCELLPEKIDLRGKQGELAADITIIIFDKVGRAEW
jgi:hypothetical protein